MNFIKNKNGFLADAFILTLGTSLAQLIPLIFYPILSRLFSPADFGILATLTSITGVIGVIASGKYETVVLIAVNKINAANIIGLALSLALSFLMIVFVCFYFFSDQISIFFNEPTLKYWIFLCPFMAFFICIYQCYNEWCVRNKYFTSLSLNKITNTSAVTLSKVTLGGINLMGGLIIGDILGRFISAVACVYHALRIDRSFFFNLSFARMKILAKRYKSCPFYIMPAQLLNTLGGELPIFLFAIYFNSSEIGYYSMALMVLSLPASVISLAIRDVFRKRANDEYIKYGIFKHIYIKTFSLLTILSIIGFSVFFVIAPALFSTVLGDKWILAGKYAQILCPMVAISFVTEVGSSMFIIAEKMKEAMWWQCCYLLLSIGDGIVLFNDRTKHSLSDQLENVIPFCLLFKDSDRLIY
ncbi:MAG: oligosaccharide flippase family protein [Odoribacter sp.]